MLERLFIMKSKQERFWLWFSRNANSFLHLEKNQDKLFSDLKRALKKIHPNLVFEFSTIFENGTRELIISADGIESLFPIVTDLVNQAPELRNWKIIAFRQPHKDITELKYGNLIIKLSDVFFRYAKDNGKIALELNIRGFYESPEWTAATFILLDTIVGEYHSEMYLSAIDKKELDENELNTLFPIKALSQILQDYQSELKN